MHPHQSWGGWDSHTSSRAMTYIPVLGEERLGPEYPALGSQTPRSQTGTELGRLAFYKYYT